MSYRTLKIMTILIPPFLIGGFEFIRHSILQQYLSMETGNYLILLLTLLISYIFATWMFKTIKEKNARITAEREMRAIYEERERLAKELHDNIAQTLFLLKVNLKKGIVNEASGLVNSIDSNVRQAIYNLRMNPSEMISFSDRVENWLNDWMTISGIDTKVTIQIPNGYFIPSEEVQLFGIIQEAFTNIRKHSRAKSAVFRLETTSNGWEMTIEDHGKGFSTEATGQHQYGLVMLKERVEKIDASLSIESRSDQGTRITVKGSGKS